MVIEEIKKQLKVEAIPLHACLNADGSVSDFFATFMENPRTRIVIHKDVAAIAASSPDLFLKSSIKTASKGEYTEHIICAGKPADMVL